MIKKGLWKHSKSGKQYRVIGVAKHTETEEEVVVYEPLYESDFANLMVRPVKMWEETVEINNEKVPRFVFLGEASIENVL
jgi:hypothetical protein